MSQFLINVLAWLLLHSGISIPEIPAIETVGFNQPVACRFDFQTEAAQPRDVPAVKRRELLRGLLFVFELPAAITTCPLENPVATAPASTEPVIRMLPVVSSLAGMVHDALLSVSDFVQATTTSVQEMAFGPVVKFVDPLNLQFASVSEFKMPNAVAQLGEFDLNRLVEQLHSITAVQCIQSGDLPDPYWTYYQDCDRWGVVMKSLDVQSTRDVAVVNTDEVFATLSKQIQMTLRVLVPGSVEMDLLQSNLDWLNGFSRSTIAWWKMFVFKGMKPSISQALQLPITWR